MKLYILRHGTTNWNQERKIQGSSDIPLDAQGEDLARITGRALFQQGIVFQKVYSSPLKRAVRTAELVAPQNSIQTDVRLKELSFGPFEGHRVPELEKEEKNPFRLFHSHPEMYNEALLKLETEECRKGYESLTTLLQRAKNFMANVIEPLIKETPENVNLLISGHGALNRALIMYMRGLDDFKEFWGIGLQTNCGFCVVNMTVSGDGSIRYTIEDENKVFFDPIALQIPNLLD